MSIRLRLARWYGAFLAVILVAFGGLSYAWHTRGHYDDLDRALLTTAEHHAAEAARTPAALHLAEDEAGFDIALRLYDAQGALIESSPQARQLPPLDPRALLARPGGPAYNALVGLIPPIDHTVAAPGRAFGLLATEQGRWRVTVVPIVEGGRAVGTIAAFAPLERLDHAMRRFQLILLGLGALSIVVASLGSWALARRVLQPIAAMITTAGGIAHSRDFSHRIAAGSVNDELHQLADTFNEMLSSLEIAYRSQQRFVADASHELRAPLTAIQGNLELLRRQPNLAEPDREEAIAEAEREARRLSRLVADLLALARADAGVRLQHAPVELDALVLEVFRSARQLASGQALALEPFEPASTLGDADRLKQLVVILIDNALKYTPAGGQVRVGLAPSPAGAVITVADSGIGIAAADLPQVFERFYRADPARTRDPGGSGLGLPIARWIVEQHGGTITIQSQPQHGTTVSVVLPQLA
jgi:signal transduction histidine kinase